MSDLFDKENNQDTNDLGNSLDTEGKTSKFSFGSISPFWKKKESKISNNILSENISETANLNDDSPNIFAELSWNLDFWHIEEEKVQLIEKDVWYYAKLGVKILLWVNIVLLIVALLYLSYIFVQKSESFRDNVALDPICWIFVPSEIQNLTTSCSSISATKADYIAESDKTKKDIIKRLSTVIYELYTVDNFVYSSEIQFLLDKKINRLKPLDILNEFDLLVNDFVQSDKSMIECKDIKVNKEYILSAKCTAYSSDWESKLNLPWITWERWNDIKEWTSMTVAASFLNYLEKTKTNKNFKLLEKQKVFQSSSVLLDSLESRRTTEFEIQMKYDNLSKNLSL